MPNYIYAKIVGSEQVSEQQQRSSFWIKYSGYAFVAGAYPLPANAIDDVLIPGAPSSYVALWQSIGGTESNPAPIWVDVVFNSLAGYLTSEQFAALPDSEKLGTVKTSNYSFFGHAGDGPYNLTVRYPGTFYVKIPSGLFTPQADVVDFNNLSVEDQTAIRDVPLSIYSGLGGGDYVLLPNVANYNQSIGGGRTLDWDPENTFVESDTAGQRVKIVGGDGTTKIKVGDGDDDIRLGAEGGAVTIGSGSDTIVSNAVVSNVDPTKNATTVGFSKVDLDSGATFDRKPGVYRNLDLRLGGEKFSYQGGNVVYASKGASLDRFWNVQFVQSGAAGGTTNKYPLDAIRINVTLNSDGYGTISATDNGQAISGLLSGVKCAFDQLMPVPGGTYDLIYRTNAGAGKAFELSDYEGVSWFGASRRNIQLHIGNNPGDSIGCIVVGNNGNAPGGGSSNFWSTLTGFMAKILPSNQAAIKAGSFGQQYYQLPIPVTLQVDGAPTQPHLHIAQQSNTGTKSRVTFGVDVATKALVDKDISFYFKISGAPADQYSLSGNQIQDLGVQADGSHSYKGTIIGNHSHGSGSTGAKEITVDISYTGSAPAALVDIAFTKGPEGVYYTGKTYGNSGVHTYRPPSQPLIDPLASSLLIGFSGQQGGSVAQAFAAPGVPAAVTAIDASAAVATTGQQVTLKVYLDRSVTIDTTNGSPTLALSNGATAVYDAGASSPANGALAFAYTVGANDYAVGLATTAVNLNGAIIRAAGGASVDFSGAVQYGLYADVNAATVTSVTPQQGEVFAGQTILLTLTMSGAVTVDTTNGAPILVLDNGAIATYDAAASSPASGTLAFQYKVSPGDASPDLHITDIDLDGATILDARGRPADIYTALDIFTGLQVGPVATGSITASHNSAMTGQVLTLFVNMTSGVVVDTSVGFPILELHHGATAVYDEAASSPTDGVLAFEYVVGATDRTTDLVVEGLRSNGANIHDEYGFNADFTGTGNYGLGVRINTAAAKNDFQYVGASSLLLQNTAGAVAVGEATSGQAVYSQIAALGREWSFEGTGVFFEDGLQAFLIENASGDVFVGKIANGVANYAQVAALGREWKFVATGDFLGDGHDQFLIENTRGEVVVGDAASGQAAYVQVAALGSEWEFVGAGDILGDGKTGFLIQNRAGVVVEGEVVGGEAIYSPVAAVGPEWEFVGTGDFLGLGHDQFLMENASGAVVVGDMSEGQLNYTQVAGLGREWSFIGTGDYSGTGLAGFMIENTAGAVVLGTIANGRATFTQIGALGGEWTSYS